MAKFEIKKDKDFGLKALIKKMKRLEEKAVYAAVGVQGVQASTDHDGITNADLAAVHEFGAPKAGIPERSFLRSTADKKERDITRRVKRKMNGLVDNPRFFNAKAVMFMVGEEFRREVIKAIDSNIPPPLKSETVRRKGDTIALVDTGQLRASITSKVVEE